MEGWTDRHTTDNGMEKWTDGRTMDRWMAGWTGDGWTAGLTASVAWSAGPAHSRGTYIRQLADCVCLHCDVVLLQFLLDFIDALRDILCLSRCRHAVLSSASLGSATCTQVLVLGVAGELNPQQGP